MLRKLVIFLARLALLWVATRWRRIAVFLAYEFMGVALMWTAYLLPRRPGPELPTVVAVLGIVCFFAGLGYGLSLFPGTRAASFHHWTGRVTAPTSPKQGVVWAVSGAVQTQEDPGKADGGIGH